MRIDKHNYEEYVMDFLEGNLSEEAIRAFEVFLKNNPEIQDEIEGLNETIVQPEHVGIDIKESLYRFDLPEEKEIEEFLIAKLEGDLNEEDEKRVDYWIESNKEIQKVWSYLLLTQLKGEQVTFDNKSRLIVPLEIDYSHTDHMIIGKLEGDLSGQQLADLQLKITGSPKLTREAALMQLTKLKTDKSIVFKNKSDLKQPVVISLWPRISYAVAGIAAILAVFFLIPNEQSDAVALKVDQLNHQVRSIALDNNISNTDPSSGQEIISFADQKNPSLIKNENQTKTDNGSNRLEGGNKISRKPISSFASHSFTEKSISGQVVSMDPIHIVDEPDYDFAENPQSKTKVFDNVFSFLQDKTKGKLWGDEQYPEDDYALALVDKTADKISEKSNVDLELITGKKDNSSWFFRLGNFEVERIKN